MENIKILADLKSIKYVLFMFEMKLFIDYFGLVMSSLCLIFSYQLRLSEINVIIGLQNGDDNNNLCLTVTHL